MTETFWGCWGPHTLHCSMPKMASSGPSLDLRNMPKTESSNSSLDTLQAKNLTLVHKSMIVVKLEQQTRGGSSGSRGSALSTCVACHCCCAYALVVRWWWCRCPRTWRFGPAACPRMGRRAPSLGCCAGVCVCVVPGAPPESFSHFHHGEATRKGAKECILAWRLLVVAALWAL